MVKLAIVDIETTGPHLQADDQLIQIAAVIVEDHHISAQYSMRLNPQRSIPPHISALTGIKECDVVKAPTFEQVAALWYERLKDCVFIAHNLAFDLTFLTYKFKEYLNLDFAPKAIDTVTLAKILFPQAPGFNLTDLSRYFAVNFDEAHDALADSRMTTYVLAKAVERLQALSEETQQQLQQIFMQLNNQTADLLDQLAEFTIIYESLAFTPTLPIESLLSDVNRVANLEIQWLFEQSAAPYKWITHHHGQLTRAQKMAYLAYLRQKPQQVMLVVAHEREAAYYSASLNKDQAETAMQYRKRSQIFSQVEFDYLWKQLPQQRYNQQELIVLGAYLVWLTETTTGYLDELNQELSLKPMLKRYWHLAKASYNHNRYWQQVQKRYQQCQFIIITAYDFCQLYLRDQLTSVIRQESHLILSDLLLLDETFQEVTALYWSCSRLYLNLRQSIDRIKYEEKIGLNQAFFADLTQCYQQVSDLLDMMQIILQEMSLTQESTEDWVSCVVDIEDPLFYGWHHQLQSVQHSLQQLQVALTSVDFVQLFDDTGTFDFIQDNLQKINTIQHSASDLYSHVIQAKLIEGQLYQLTVKQQQNQAYIDYQQLQGSFAAISCWGSQSSSFQNIDSQRLAQFKALNLTFNSQPIQLKVPEFASKDSLKTLLTLLKLDQNQRVLVVCTSKSRLNELYAQLMTSDFMAHQYSILAAGITGSVKKVFRKAREGQRAILLVSKSQLMTEAWQAHLDFDVVCLQSLPFLSLEDMRIMADKKRAQLSSNEVFDQLVLPRMIEELASLVNYLTAASPQACYYLLDVRIMTRYYGETVRQALVDRILFESV